MSKTSTIATNTNWTPQWVPCAAPQGVRFDTPRRCQGQIVEVSYADHRPYADGADETRHPETCAVYRRTIDRSTGATNYSRLANSTTADTPATIRTAKGHHTGTIAECWAWQEEMQASFADLEVGDLSVDIDLCESLDDVLAAVAAEVSR
jgi:hypothetical protein